MRTAMILGALLTLTVPGRPSESLSARPDETAARFMAPQTLVYLEAPDLSALLDEGLGHPLIERLRGSELGRMLLREAGASPEAGLAMAAVAYGRPLLPALSSMTSGGVALGVRVRSGMPAWTLVARGDDAELWRTMWERTLELYAEQFESWGEMTIPREQVGDAELWLLDEAVAALRGSDFVFGNDEGAVRNVLERLKGGGESLLSRQDFAAALGERPRDSFLWSWMDVDGIAALEGDSMDDLRAMIAKPEVHFLLGSGFALAGQAESLSASAHLDADRIALEVIARGIAEGPAEMLLPTSAKARMKEAPSLPREHPRESARALFYRDVAGVFRQRGELFPSHELPSFGKAITDLSILFGGLDLEDDILPGLSPWVRVLARPVDFDPAALPEIPLPAVAILVDVAEAERVGQRLVGAFQTAIGLANIDSTQKGRKPLVLGLEAGEGVQISYATFPAPAEGDGVDLEYNLVPACCMVKQTFVLGTHRALVRELALEIAGGAAGVRAPGDEYVHLDGSALARMVADNSEALVVQAMLDKGKSEEQARKEMEGLQAALQLVKDIELRSERAADGSLTFELELTLTASEDER